MKQTTPSPNKRQSAWQDYERLKYSLREKNLTPKEYEKEIRRIAKRLGL